MFQEIVAEIAIDFRTDRICDVREINDPDIDRAQFCFANRERINFSERHGNFSAGTLTFFRTKNLYLELLRQVRRKQRRSSAGIENKIKRAEPVHVNWKQNQRLGAASQAKTHFGAG